MFTFSENQLKSRIMENLSKAEKKNIELHEWFLNNLLFNESSIAFEKGYNKRGEILDMELDKTTQGLHYENQLLTILKKKTINDMKTEKLQKDLDRFIKLLK
jgi:hypothetical protein